MQTIDSVDQSLICLRESSADFIGNVFGGKIALNRSKLWRSLEAGEGSCGLFLFDLHRLETCVHIIQFGANAFTPQLCRLFCLEIVKLALLDLVIRGNEGIQTPKFLFRNRKS